VALKPLFEKFCLLLWIDNISVGLSVFCGVFIILNSWHKKNYGPLSPFHPFFSISLADSGSFDHFICSCTFNMKTG
jgi:hypothetical protein